jgi:PAS domain S-box-containing protein
VSSSIHVLLVEDVSADAKLVANALSKLERAVEIERVEEAQAFRSALAARRWDIVLSDWSLPKFSALEALRILQASGKDVPFIIVSGTIGEETAVDAMRAGARDYVLKDRLNRLAPSVSRELTESHGRQARREAEASLHESETRFKRLFESGVVGIAIATTAGTVVDANDMFLRMVGRPREDLANGKINWRAMTPPEWRDADESESEQLRSAGEVQPWEQEFMREDGARVPVLIGLTALDEHRYLALVLDLTARKHAERASLQLASAARREQLGRKRAEQALEQRDAQLRQAQKMEAMGRLAGGVAHDFNNALSVILSYSDIIYDVLRPEDPMRDDVLEVRKAANQAAQLTRQLLLFSRQQMVAPRVVDLNEVIAGLDRMFARILGEDVVIETSLDATKPRILVDASGIEQVIMNLVVNARDAMPRGGTLAIATRNASLDEEEARARLTKPGMYVVLTVTDTGVGMSEEVRAQIFEPFFTTKEAGKGTGLGLSTVFGIVQQGGGIISVVSQPGEGAAFEIHWPLASGVVEASAVVEPAREGRGHETILLVEDDDQVRMVARSILRRAGYRVLEARNAGEAMIISEKHEGTIHLLLSDVVMPQMSGPELAKRLALGRPDMKVLCMSGYMDESVLRHGALDLEVSYLEKPLTPERLTHKVRDVLDHTRKRKEG